MRRRSWHRGSAIIEFTLVGVPLIFVLLSIFELSRGMWVYTALAHSVKEGTRFAIVHGNNCTVLPNNCIVNVREIANQIAYAGAGLIPADLQNVRFISDTRIITCPTLKSCQDAGATGDTYWPALPRTDPAYPDAGSARFANLRIEAQYPFESFISMLWPGAGPGITFGRFLFQASSQEAVQF